MHLYPKSSRRTVKPAQAGLWLLGLILAAGCAHTPKQTALDRYIAAPDPNYAYHLLNTVPGKGCTTFVLEMTSQSWLTAAEVDRPVWKHWLIITRPEGVTNPSALLFIGGGSNDNPPPKGADSNMARIAVATKSIVAELKLVPNQPLVFTGDGQKRSEDELIAYTWDRYLRTGDDRWPARLPMTKAAVRAMDTVTAFCGSAEGGRCAVNTFVVAGGSKRGWTTWTTAAVDKRVIGIVPIVIDLLNIEPSFKHHWEAYGFYAPAVHDYVEMGIMEWQGTPQYHNLMSLVEPYSYRKRYTLPKLLMNATGDQFFLPDSSQFYFQDLPGEKYLRYVPNADHSLKDTDALETLAAFHHAVIHRIPLPRFTWSSEADGTLRVRTQDKPAAIKLWQATNPSARDFRLETLGKAWTSTDLAEQETGLYVGKVPSPEKGWTAFLVELTYTPKELPTPIKFTTQVNVIPTTMPFRFDSKKAVR